jgi:hypothetical protein
MKLKKNLLWYYWANLNQTLLKWFLDGPLPNLCPVIPNSNQDGRQARNRKKGGWNFNCPLLLDTILKGTHPGTIPARFGLIWFRCFRGEDLNVKVYIAALVLVKMSSNFNCSYMARSSLTIVCIFLWNFSFSRFIPIMQIRHILIKDHI